MQRMYHVGRQPMHRLMESLAPAPISNSSPYDATNDTLTTTTTGFTNATHDAALHEPLLHLGWIHATVISVYLFLLACIGCGLNIALVTVFSRKKELRTPINWLFMNLTIGDLMVGLGPTFTAFAHTATRTPMQETVCYAYGFLAFLGGTGSIVAVTILAFERFLCVMRPCNISSTTLSRAYAYIAFTWCYAAIIAGGPLVGLGRYTREAYGTWCSIDWEEATLATDIYIVFIFIFAYFFPLVIVAGCYGAIYRKVKQVAEAQKSRSTTAKAQGGVLRQSVAIVVCLITAWTPYAVLCLIVTIIKVNPFSAHVAAAPSLFAKTSICWNPIIYFGLNTQFRSALVSMLPCKRKAPVAARSRSSCAATIGATPIKTQSVQVLPVSQNLHPTKRDLLLASSQQTKPLLQLT